MDIEWLKEAYQRTRKDGAVGVDGITAEEYEQDLEGNLQRLLDRAKAGTYRHWSLGEQQQKLNEKLRGHYAYYGVTGNSAALSRFLFEVKTSWRKWLYSRRS